MALATILWVDDEIESLQSQKLFLENKGYTVQTFTNGFEAIDFVKEHAVDVVLLDETMPGITGLETQKQEANTEFFKFVSKNYASWLKSKSNHVPVMSHTLFKERILPEVKKGTPTFFVLIDNLRYDQWKTIQPIFAESFRILEEE